MHNNQDVEEPKSTSLKNSNEPINISQQNQESKYIQIELTIHVTWIMIFYRILASSHHIDNFDKSASKCQK